MLGVLLILAILITMLVSVVGLVQRKTQQYRAEADANALVQAVLHYRQVYGTWPCETTNENIGVYVAGNKSLADMLNNMISIQINGLPISLATNVDLAAIIAALAPKRPDNTDNPANMRQIIFLATPTTALVNGLSDPWGNPYLLVMGAEQCPFTPLGFSNLPAFAISAGIPAANPGVSNWIFSAGVKP